VFKSLVVLGLLVVR